VGKLVSILIPAYNAQKWIKDTIRSAQDQSWPKKEIIIVDDGSSDNTYQIAKEFESESVKAIRQENMGGPAARNKALSIAQGDYIQWLDHDDLLAPDKITKQMMKIDGDGNSRILYSSISGTFYYCHQRAKFIRNSLWKDITPLEYFFIKFIENAWLQPAVWLVSRRLTEIAGPWYERRSPDDDGEYLCRIVKASEAIKFIPEAKSYWRIGNFGSMSRSRSDESLDAIFTATALCIDHFRSIEDSERTRAASLKYLQSRLGYFYPEQKNVLVKAEALAKELGGELAPPDASLKFTMLSNILGWKTASKIKNYEWNAEMFIRRIWDRMLYMLYYADKR
jgi:glycosyltransferase involved in cell wall biosynthesis